MAAYTQGFVVSIIGSNGKVIRESNVNNQRVVRLPFDSEYKIRIQNKNLYRAYAKILIDGTEVHTGKFILRGNSTLDLERFDLDGNMSSGRKFKFVPLSNSDVQDPTSKENGIVKVVFEPEDTSPYNLLFRSYDASSGGILRGMNFKGGLEGTTIGATYSVNTTATNSSTSINLNNTSGATVEGGLSNQQFVETNEHFSTLSPISMKIKMEGLGNQKDWKVIFNQGKMDVSVVDMTIPHTEEVAITPTHLVIKIPISQVQIG